METLMYVGGGFFVVGLVLSHVVVGLTRRSVRAHEPIGKTHRQLMWLALIMAVGGFAAAVTGFLWHASG